MTYIAYVPAGAVARGAALASDSRAGQPCASCHGAGLKGGLGPPLAGRSPTYLARQLMSFQAGGRRSPEAAAMRARAARLSDAQIIDLAAYAAAPHP